MPPGMTGPAAPIILPIEAGLQDVPGMELSDRRTRTFLDALGRAPRATARALIAVYRFSFAALAGLNCRHLPTCSSYADEAIGRFGLWAGGWMTLARLCRCHPFGTSGLDLVPPARPQHARWYLPWRYGRWRGTNQPAEPARIPLPPDGDRS